MANIKDSNLPVGKSNNTSYVPTSTSMDKMEILRKKYNYKPEINELDKYDNVTYHLKFSMISTGPIAKEMVIAESGSTVMNINSFNMTQTVAPNQYTRNIGTNTMKMNIYDPFSADIYDKLKLAAKSLLIQDATKAVFCIKISFMGYDPTNGKQITNIYGVDVIKCLMIDINTTINESGSLHDITLVELADQGFMDEYMYIDRSQIIQSSSGTLGEILSNLKTRLNVDKKNDYYGIPMVEYDFQYENYDSQDIKDGVTNPKDLIVQINSSDKTQPNRNPDDMTAGKSSSIQNIIEQMLANSPTAVKLLGNVDPQTGYAPDTFIYGVGHKILISVSYGNWYEIFNSYSKKITYKIVPYKSYHIFNSPDNINKFVNDDSMSMNKFKLICNNNCLKKEYNYQYTGKNTEILNFDIKTAMNYSYIFLPAMGVQTYSKNSVPAKYVRDGQQIKSLTTQIESNKFQLDQLNKQISTITDNTQKTSLTNKISDLSSNIKKMSDQLNPLIEDYTRETNNIQTNKNDVLKQLKDSQYVDDIELTQEKTENNMLVPSSVLTTNIDTLGTSGMLEQHRDSGQAIYSALLGQYYGSDTAALQTVNIGIRFDPYWITNKTTSDNTSTNSTIIPLTDVDYGTQQNYSDQFAHFILNFNIPTGVDDTTGNIILNNSDIYTGVYQVITVTSEFNGGAMSQNLNAVKLNVLSMNKIINGDSNDTTSNIPITPTVTSRKSDNVDEWPDLTKTAKSLSNSVSTYIDKAMKKPMDYIKEVSKKK